MYIDVKIRIIIIDNRLNILSVLKISLDNFNPLFSIFLRSINETTIIKSEINRNEISIWSRKGISGKRNFKTAETGIEIIVPHNAAPEVVFFQYIPRTKIAVTPGLIIPVYS